MLSAFVTPLDVLGITVERFKIRGLTGNSYGRICTGGRRVLRRPDRWQVTLMNGTNIITRGRAELYDRVWSAPISVGHRLGGCLRNGPPTAQADRPGVPAEPASAGRNPSHAPGRSPRGPAPACSPAVGQEPTVAVAVGPERVSLALRFLDALVKCVERVGGRVETRKPPRGWRCETAAVFGGEAVPLRLREQYRQVAVPESRRESQWGSRCECVLTGEFIPDSDPSVFCDCHAKDGQAAGTEEEHFSAILVKFVELAGEARVHRRHREAERQWREEEERRRREQAERERREQLRVERLLAGANAWRQASDMRGYVAAVEERAAAWEMRADAGTELGVWLSWARDQTKRPGSVGATLSRLAGGSATEG